MKNLDNPPIACSLEAAELRKREATLLTKFRSGVLETEELADGYAFRLSGDANSVRLVAELIAAERACCPFLIFEVVALPNMGSLTVRITGPVGGREFVKSLLVRPKGATPGGPNKVS
jgi:hypothetical protein